MVGFKRRRGGELGKEDLPYRIVIIINKVVESYNGDDDDATSQYLSGAQMAALYLIRFFPIEEFFYPLYSRLARRRCIISITLC
jgi:hypothetical protein